MSLQLLHAPWALAEKATFERLLARWPTEQTLADLEAALQAKGINAEGASGETRGAGVIAVIPVAGIILPRVSALMAFFGGVSTTGIAARVRMALAEPSVQAVVLDIHSPGGSVYGVTELATYIRSARGAKPIVAQANHVAASAAYWLGSAADEFVGTPSSEVGSIGVYAVHEDLSEMAAKAGVKCTIISAGPLKTAGNELEPLSDEGRADMQAKVDHYYSLFVGDVAAGRGVTQAAVREGYGKGLTMTAPGALKAGMIDRVATLDETLARLSSHQGRRAAMKQAQAEDGDADRRLRRAALTGL